MELHALDRELAVAQSHQFAVVAEGGGLEAAGKDRQLDGERVIADRAVALGQPAEDALAVVRDRRALAVHHPARAHHAGAERGPDRLVPQTDAENGDALAEAANERYRDACTGGR